MTSLIPLYLKTSYKNEPLFEKSKVVTSVYNDCFNGSLDKTFAKKAMMDGVTKGDVEKFIDPTHENLCRAAASWADGVIVGSKDSAGIVKDLDVPTLDYQGEEYIDAYNEFYDQVLVEEEVMAE
jgi:starch synthase